MQKKNTLFIVFIIFIASFCFSSLSAIETTRTDLKAIHYGKLLDDIRNVNLNISRDDTVIYEIVKEPTEITGQTTYYDYCPGGYWANPIAYQGESYIWDNFYYMTFMQRTGTTAEDNRRQNWAALNHTSLDIGSSFATISTYDVWQGFGGIDIHQPSGYCIASWHEKYDTDALYELTLAYDDLATFGIPGFWSSTVHFWNTAVNEYIWPRIYVGPSPVGPDYSRVYQTSTNSAEDGEIVQKSDLKIEYIDVENVSTDLSVLLDTNNWTTITPLLYWVDDYSIRPDPHFAVNYNPGHEGEVVIVGTNYWYDEDLTYSPVEEGLFVWESSLGPNNELLFEESNLHTDGPGDFFYGVENVIGMSTDSGVTPDSIYVGDRGTHSVVKYDSDSKLHWVYTQMYYIPSDQVGYISIFRFAYPQAEVIWDGANFSFKHNQYMPYIDEWSGHDVPFMVDSSVVPADTSYFFDLGFSLYQGTDGDPDCGQENLQQLATNFDNGNEWMCWLWVDGTYSALGSTDYFVDPDPEYIPYVEHPIIYISVSDNNGANWAVPIKLTDLALEGINVYPYSCSKIKDIEDGWGQLVIYYLDDFVFNSTISTEQQPDAGAILKYMVVNIDFSNLPPTSVDPDNPNIFDLTLNNSPNPFFSSTMIKFTAKKSFKKAEINVYNIRGQLVTTLDVQAGEQPTQGYSTWNGKDMHGKDVSNGVYFYKVEIDGASKVQKMMLAR